jgi:hypothetical protein
MARREHVYTVFVASPSDVVDERNKLEEIIRELNTAWGRELCVRLDLVRWETHAYPGIGIDAQDVINNQIPDDFDLFIGILWCKYGTPTGRAGSGTIEEYQRAKERHDKNPDGMRIMVYFKDEAIPPSRLDPSQLTSINAFRDSLGKEGVLYWKFNSTEQFGQFVRLHLTRQVQAWKKKWDEQPGVTLPAAPPRQSIEKSDSSSEEDDIGILDYIERFEERTAELVAIAERLSKATEYLGLKINGRTEDMNSLPRDAQGNVNRKDAKKYISKAASDMENYTKRVDAELPLFKEAMNTGVNSLIRALSMSVDHETQVEKSKEGLDAIVNLRSVLSGSKQHLVVFRGTVASVPRMTTELNRAKRASRHR